MGITSYRNCFLTFGICLGCFAKTEYYNIDYFGSAHYFGKYVKMCFVFPIQDMMAVVGLVR